LASASSALRSARLTVPPSFEISTDAVDFGNMRFHSMLIRVEEVANNRHELQQAKWAMNV
jgi:hypothetical protein